MSAIGWIATVVLAVFVFSVIIVPIITLIAEELDNSPRRREARIIRRVTDARSEISGIFTAAAEAMNRRAGRDDSFRLGRKDRW